MPVDPKQDVDICITCLTKSAPKLPLREELPSLGVELIYKARGIGAKVSKHEARRAARDYRDKESFKDLKKRRIFPKSSKRIKEILEVRRRCENEIKHNTAAISYESYQHELYGGWATDTSTSSRSRSKQPSSSSDSSVSEIRTTGNRKMTKVALKRWRLFRKRSQKRKAQRMEKQKQEKRKKKAQDDKLAQDQISSIGSFLGEDYFADFLAPVPRVDDEKEEVDDYSDIAEAFKKSASTHTMSTPRKRLQGSSTQSYSHQTRPSWSFPDIEEPLSSSSRQSSRPSSYIDHLSPSSALHNASKDSYQEDDIQTPHSFERLGRPSTENQYSNLKSPSPTLGGLQSPKDTTPTTLATSPSTPAADSFIETSSTISSITGSHSKSRQEKLKEGNTKLSSYFARRQSRLVEQSIQETESKESTSDTSLIGLSVAFPKDSTDDEEDEVDLKNDDFFLGRSSPPASSSSSSSSPRSKRRRGPVDLDDPYISDDTDSKENSKGEDVPHSGQKQFQSEEQSGVLDAVPSSVYGPTKSYSWKDPSLLGMGGFSQEMANNDDCQAAQNTDKHESKTPEQPFKREDIAAWGTLQPSSSFSDEIPEDLYQAFGISKDRTPGIGMRSTRTKSSNVRNKKDDSQNGPIIVPGVDLSEAEKEYLKDSSTDWDNTLLVGEESDMEAQARTQDSSDSPVKSSEKRDSHDLLVSWNRSSEERRSVPKNELRTFSNRPKEGFQRDYTQSESQNIIPEKPSGTSNELKNAWDVVLPQSKSSEEQRYSKTNENRTFTNRPREEDYREDVHRVDTNTQTYTEESSGTSNEIKNAWDVVLPQSRSSEEQRYSKPNETRIFTNRPRDQDDREEVHRVDTNTQTYTQVAQISYSKTKAETKHCQSEIKDSPPKKKRWFGFILPHSKSADSERNRNSERRDHNDGDANSDDSGNGDDDAGQTTNPIDIDTCESDSEVLELNNPIDRFSNWWESALPSIESSGAQSSSKANEESSGSENRAETKDTATQVDPAMLEPENSPFPSLADESKVAAKLDESAVQAFADIPDEFYGALDRHSKAKHDSDDQSLKCVVKTAQMTLTQYDMRIDEMMNIIAEDPTLAQMKDPDDGQMLLHRFASSPFPFHVATENFIELLLDDIHIFRGKLDLIFNAFPAASEVVDSDGDLPIHHLARNLMHWETTWYARVYESASKEVDGSGPATTAITDLYHTMSLCVETLLFRVVKDGKICRERGSLGSLLPLHIATIFTSSVTTLREALESYPESAFEASEIKGFDSFVPDGSLPIEIHEAFCTDFPKWEVEVNGPAERKWSMRRNEKETSLDDSIRRSDLLFAYNPSIQRFWKDDARIRRFERQINFEAKQVAETNRESISKAAARVWIWMCTYTGAQKSHAIFERSIKRIIEDLPFSLVRMLASLPAPSGEPILDVAHQDCVTVIRQRLEEISEVMTPIMSFSESSQSTASRVLHSWDEIQRAKLAEVGKLNLGQVCKVVFNIKEGRFPTSFVILPYKLARNANGSLGMSSPEYASAAIKFAECLLELTDPKSILYFLERKSEAYFGVSMYEGATDAIPRQKAFNHVAELEKALLGLYAQRVAYLYLLDEETGVPLVPFSDSLYPMVLNEPVSIVRKLLPMMIPGMIQMRGEKAVSVLSTVLLDSSIMNVPVHYEDAAKKLSIFMYLKGHDDKESAEEFAFMKKELNRFLASFKNKVHREKETITGTTEWNVELSILSMLFEVNDPNSNFSGLCKDTEEAKNDIRWVYNPSVEAAFPVRQKPEPQVVIYTDRQIQAKYGHDSFSQSENRSTADSYTTFGVGPLKFHQPPDDSTATTFETQASPNLADDDVALATTTSVESTESETIKVKYNMLSDTFAVDRKYRVVDASKSTEPGAAPVHPAEQVWTDVTNRLEATSFFWDEAQVTSLRVSLAQQANKLCLLQKRIKDMKDDESEHAKRVHELFCQLMGDNVNVLEVPSPRSLFGMRKLLARLNDLESRILEAEVDSQHVQLRVETLNEELFDMIPMVEEESSYSSDDSSSSYEILSCVSETDVSQKSCIIASEGESDEIECEGSAIISEADSKPASSVHFDFDEQLSSRIKAESTSKAAATESKRSGAWSPSRSIERIRKAFAAARRDHTSPVSRYSGDTESKSSSAYFTTSDGRESKLSSPVVAASTRFRRTALRERAAAAAAAASLRKKEQASSSSSSRVFPVDIALPALDHHEASVGPQSRVITTTGRQTSEGDQSHQSGGTKGNHSESSTSKSSMYETSSVVKYDKETGRIEF